MLLILSHAGVRYSLINPEIYIRTNLPVSIFLKIAKYKVDHLVYASQFSLWWK